MIGVGFASVSVVLSIFTAILVKCFEANHDLPTNLVIIRGVVQIILFAVAVAQGDQFILPASRKEKLLVITRGFLTGVLFFSNIAALRFLPLGDVFTILTARSIVCIIFSAVVLCIYRKNSGILIFNAMKCCYICFVKTILLILTKPALFCWLLLGFTFSWEINTTPLGTLMEILRLDLTLWRTLPFQCHNSPSSSRSRLAPTQFS